MNDGIMLGLQRSIHGCTGVIGDSGKILTAINLERLTRQKNDPLLNFTYKELVVFGVESLFENKDYHNLPLNEDTSADYPSLENNEKLDLLIDKLLTNSNVQFSDIKYLCTSTGLSKHFLEYCQKRNPKIQLFLPEHHYSHACQAYFGSHFDEAAIMVLDGSGEHTPRANNKSLSGCLAYGDLNQINLLHDFPLSCSLGAVYGGITIHIGFKFNEDGKTMGLAPYGNSTIYDLVKDEIKYDMYKYNVVNTEMFNYYIDSPKELLFSLGNWRKYCDYIYNFPEDRANLAFMAQQITEDVMIYLGNYLYEKTRSKNLCIAGGVGLNCVSNYKVYANTKFENIFIYPNAGDNGLMVGSMFGLNNLLQNKRCSVPNDYLGIEYSKSDIKNSIRKYENSSVCKIQEFQNINKLCNITAKLISDGNVVGWWQGRSEFGPRALGNRSILADPRRSDMKDILNIKVKHRERFRPFSPSVLLERCSEFFELDIESPYMLLAPPVKNEKIHLIPAVTHVDKTSRVQTVTKESNLRYYTLIKEFEKMTDIPMVLNTSFNVAGEPMVETPEDALNCFFSTEIDILVIDNIMITKESLI